ncbi:flavodoxin [Pseudonocardiaceae bacterium YIM PH 21723]|nr:flavodoxin [Pseudonocardiaceae bacterium YIM PH 21723]
MTTSGEPRRFLFLLGSARADGNTEYLARTAAAQLPAGAEQRWIRLADHPLPVFVDGRYGPETYPAVTEHSEALREATTWATDVVIAAPLYWYSLPAAVKLYLESWNSWFLDTTEGRRQRLTGKTLWGVTVFEGEHPDHIRPWEDALRFTAEYMWMRYAGTLVGLGDRVGDIERDTDGLAAAKTFFAG